jgi:predicted dehydrogenase
MEKVRLGLIGCGGRAKSHMKSFLAMDDVIVAAVADPIEERREEAAKMFGCTNVFKNHSELLDYAAGNLDALVIFRDAKNIHTRGYLRIKSVMDTEQIT